MAVVDITFSPPIDFILRQHGRFRRELDDFSELWEMLKPVISQIEQDRFDQEGPGWAPLAASTLSQKSRDGWPSKILHRTLTLRDSLVDPSQAFSGGAREMTWGTGVFYAGFHQDGTEKMPARPVIDIDAAARRRIEQETVRWINRVAARVF